MKDIVFHLYFLLLFLSALLYVYQQLKLNGTICKYEKILDESDDQHLALAPPIFWLLNSCKTWRLKSNMERVKLSSWDFLLDFLKGNLSTNLTV